MANSTETVLFFKSRREAIKHVDLWRGRGYHSASYLYNPDYAEAHKKDDTPYLVIFDKDDTPPSLRS